MSRSTILVSGAAGKIGSAVVAELLAAGVPVRALVRRRDARSDALERAGASIAVGDLTDTVALIRAMAGTQRAFFLPPFGPSLLHAATSFATAAQEVRLESVVALSQWLASPSHPSLTTRQHWLADRLFANLPGIAVTTVNPGFFADNYLRTLPYAAHLGILPWIYGHGRNAPPSNEDIGRVAAHALMRPDLHAGRQYRPTGPRLLSRDDIAGVIANVVGHRVIPVPMPMWMFRKAARLNGASIDELAGYGDYAIDHDQGAFELGAPTSHVEDVTGRPAEDFETTVRRYAALAINRPTVLNRVLQFATFMAVPFVPGYAMSRHERAIGIPAPAVPEHAIASSTWLREHGLSRGARVPTAGDRPARPGRAVADA